MNQKRSKGFSLLEVILALVVITSAGLGVYTLFDSGIKSNNLSDATNQVIEIANVYTDLASSNLTASVSEEADLVTLLQNSGRLPNKYFSSSSTTGEGGAITTTVTINNAFGTLDFSSPAPTPYSFVVEVPLGSINDKSSAPDQLFSKVQDVYSCDAAGGKTDCSVEKCTGAQSSRCIKLYFNLNN